MFEQDAEQAVLPALVPEALAICLNGTLREQAGAIALQRVQESGKDGQETSGDVLLCIGGFWHRHSFRCES